MPGETIQMHGRAESDFDCYLAIPHADDTVPAWCSRAQCTDVELHIFSGIKHAYMMPDACAAFSKTTREFSMARALAILNNLRSSSEKLRKAP